MVREVDKRASVYFTVDFEDFTHDLCRALKAFAPSQLRDKSLYKSLSNINELLALNYSNNQNITFFCTGVIADRYPDLVKVIAEQGHEIACHGNFHDDINLPDPFTPSQNDNMYYI